MLNTVVVLFFTFLIFAPLPSVASDAQINNKSVGDVFEFCQRLQKIRPFKKEQIESLVQELKPDSGKFPVWKFKSKDGPFKSISLWKDKDDENLVSVIEVDLNTRAGIKKKDMQDCFGNESFHATDSKGKGESYHFDRQGAQFQFAFDAGGPPRMCKLVVSRRY